MTKTVSSRAISAISKMANSSAQKHVFVVFRSIMAERSNVAPFYVGNTKGDVHFPQIRPLWRSYLLKMAAAAPSSETRCSSVGRNSHKCVVFRTFLVCHEVKKVQELSIFFRISYYSKENVCTRNSTRSIGSVVRLLRRQSKYGYLRLARMRGGSAERGRGSSHFIFCYKLTLGELQECRVLLVDLGLY